MSEHYVERYYVCGGYGSVRIFDRERQDYLPGKFTTNGDAEAALAKIDAPKGFGAFMEKERTGK